MLHSEDTEILEILGVEEGTGGTHKSHWEGEIE